MRGYISAYIDYLRYERHFSAHTLVAYTTDLAQFASFIEDIERSDGDTLLPEQIDADIVRGWMMAMMRRSLASSSVNRKLSALQSFFKYLIRQGVVRIHPFSTVTGPKKPKALPYFIQEKEMNRLLDEEDFGDGFGGARDRLIIEMFYETGIRCSELVGIQNADVDTDAMLLKVTGKRNKQRFVPFAERLKDMIDYYINVRAREVASESTSFFLRPDGRPVTSAIVYYAVKKKLSNIPTLSKRSPHVLRHTFATSMLNDGAELSAIRNLLGHSSLASTSVYTHVTFEELKKVYNAHPRAKN